MKEYFQLVEEHQTFSEYLNSSGNPVSAFYAPDIDTCFTETIAKKMIDFSLELLEIYTYQ